MQDLKERILKFWKTNEEWSMVSLGKGYYEFIFSSLDDLSAEDPWVFGTSHRVYL
jgi:hypothetical protein